MQIDQSPDSSISVDVESPTKQSCHHESSMLSLNVNDQLKVSAPHLGFFHFFSEFCFENGMEPPTQLMAVLKSQDACTGKLKLCGTIFNSVTLRALIYTIQSSSQAMVSLDLSDCNLGDNGLITLANCLNGYKSTSWKLNLKGNNLTSASCIVLGDLLRVNQQLFKLGLKWNSLGANDKEFSNLCSGLSLNTGLLSLDLRSNCLTSVSVKHLTEALKINSDLETIDLRWNSISSLGGEALCAMLKYNTSLQYCYVEGNGFQRDLVGVIKSRLECNRERIRLTHTNNAVVESANVEIEKAYNEANKLSEGMAEDLKLQQSVFEQHVLESGKKEKQLMEQLQTQTSLASVSQSQVAGLESQLLMEKNSSRELQRKLDIATTQIQHDMSKREHDMDGKNMEISLLTNQLQAERQAVDSKFSNFEHQVQSHKKRIEQQQVVIDGLNEKIALLKTDNDVLRATQQQAIDELQRQHQIGRSQIEKHAQERVERQIKENEKIVVAINQQVEDARREKIVADDKITSLMSQLTANKVECHDEITKERARIMKQSEDDREMLERRLAELRKENDRLITANNQLKLQHEDARSRIHAIGGELETARELRDQLKRDLTDRRTAIEEATSHIKTEINDWKRLYESERENTRQLRRDIAEMEQNTQLKHTSLIGKVESKDSEIADLKRSLAQKEAVVEALMKAEQRKMALLKSTVDSLYSDENGRNTLEDTLERNTGGAKLGLSLPQPMPENDGTKIEQSDFQSTV